ncbi:uncharacterized protein LOC134845558 isoform X2 [Symsagittifera roscoffensis]|uniref:uncharacterized protein LOC134845558 isoform X2 n=1 Tax=Symsagittifera roscoffensis TaxID=84072 RepID=UPI00307B4750
MGSRNLFPHFAPPVLVTFIRRKTILLRFGRSYNSPVLYPRLHISSRYCINILHSLSTVKQNDSWLQSCREEDSFSQSAEKLSDKLSLPISNQQNHLVHNGEPNQICWDADESNLDSRTETERRLSGDNKSSHMHVSESFTLDRSVLRNKKALKKSSISSSSDSTTTTPTERRIRFSLNFELDDDYNDHERSDRSCLPKLSPVQRSLDDCIESPVTPRRKPRSSSPESLPFADEDEDQDELTTGFLSSSPPLGTVSTNRLVTSSPGCDVTSELHLADMIECDNLSFDESFSEILNGVHPAAEEQQSSSVNTDGEVNKEDSELDEFLSLLKKDSLQNQLALNT